tara:strand:+ start:499 stop:1308 length:810 start_codon:yes stop_codon:yes gene_type:complete
MRNWYKYFFSDKKETDFNDRFLFTNHQLLNNKQNFKDVFSFENLKQDIVLFKQYNFLRNNLDANKKVLFVGSSWGVSEFFLKDEFKITASDIEDEYVKFHKNNTNLNYIKLDILNLKNQNFKYEQIVINNIEYLFDNNEFKRLIQNISKISKPETKIFIIFRSRDGFLIKLIDQILLPIETYFVYLIKRVFKKVYFLRGHHGFRRNLQEFKKLWVENNFEYQSIHEDLYQIDYQRLRVVQNSKIINFLCGIFLKSNPYLNILTFQKSKK